MPKRLRTAYSLDHGCIVAGCATITAAGTIAGMLATTRFWSASNLVYVTASCCFITSFYNN